MVYASISGSRERSGVQHKLPLFVLEAEPGATAPLRSLFTTPILEEALQWSPQPGESALSEVELPRFRSGLNSLVAPLLARLSADRPERGAVDKKALLEFAHQVEPVESLTLTCAFRDEDLGVLPQRNYFVRRSPTTQVFQGFIRWNGPAWPPAPEDAQSLAMALAEALGVNTVETFLSFISATESVRRQLLDLAGASDRLTEVERELAEGEDSGHEPPTASENLDAPESTKATDGQSTEGQVDGSVAIPPTRSPAAPLIPLRHFEDLLFDGEVVHVQGAGATPNGSKNPSGGLTSDRTKNQAPPRAAAGMHLAGLDRLGMQITLAFEKHRLDGRKVVILPGDEDPAGADALVLDVSSPETIASASEQSEQVRNLFAELAREGISPVYPGFDILTIVDSKVDRMIELKSSGVDAQIQAMSWNEWKTAGGSLRHHFWLYLVGNLRADLNQSLPFVRTVQDPFGTLASTKTEDVVRKRSVQLRIREFAAADELVLQLKPSEDI